MIEMIRGQCGYSRRSESVEPFDQTVEGCVFVPDVQGVFGAGLCQARKSDHEA
jgi:hypothetical protein